jgi:peptide/nickel transport system substrate-binding protein
MRPLLIAFTVLLSGAAAAQQPDLSQSGLVGKLENPTIVTDPAQWPKKFGEAPALAELVKAGKLPSVDKRIPQEPMVIKPLRSVGKYGGTWRRGFLGPGDGENGNRVRSSGTRRARVLRRTSPRVGRPAPTAAAPPCFCARA